MNVGILADIHGNLPALTAVMERLGGCELLICAGDLTGYGPFAREVVQVLEARNAVYVLGNHDSYVLEGLLSHPNPLVMASVKATKHRMTESDLQRLSTHQTRMRFSLEAKQVLVVHGSPWDPLAEYVYPSYPTWERFLGLTADVIIMGHTHHAMVRKIGDKLLVNPGSVGQARDQRGKACYAVWDTVAKTVSLQAVDYPKHKILSRLAEEQWPEVFASLLTLPGGGEA